MPYSHPLDDKEGRETGHLSLDSAMWLGGLSTVCQGQRKSHANICYRYTDNHHCRIKSNTRTVDGWDYQSQTVVEWSSPYLIRNCIIIIADKKSLPIYIHW